MKEIYETCTYVLSWIIVNNTSSMPADVYDDMCGNIKNQVSEELRKWSQCYMASNRLHTIKVEDAKHLLYIYKQLLGE